MSLICGELSENKVLESLGGREPPNDLGLFDKRLSSNVINLRNSAKIAESTLHLLSPKFAVLQILEERPGEGLT